MPKYIKTEGLLKIFLSLGVFNWTRKLASNSLTVLNYHRVSEKFDDFSFSPNISADMRSFDRQMAYLNKNYNVISMSHLIMWLKGERDMPHNPALITFDDGYYDNYSIAHPILLKFGLPATIFLTSGYIGGNKPFIWDFAACCFSLTQNSSAMLPLLGNVSWDGKKSKDRILFEFVNQIKRLDPKESAEIIREIPGILGVVVPKDSFNGLYLDWNHVRELSNQGIEFGAHTVSHPILTSISLDKVSNELSESKSKIEKETGHEIQSFAYPNGGIDDFSAGIIRVVQEIGFDIAFTLLPGFSSWKAIQKNPYTVRRIFIGNSDSFPRFVGKLSGLNAVSQALT